jgi:murein DD-endopeptidase MepM/ murein hydrolase activator NlpD
MDVGTYLTAVRAGTVVWVKGDYHMSGTTQYFLDKANVIKVLHDDGTFASYAHILMDTAMVKEGDKVGVGDKLARSGSSGFSTGPHLHFSIIKNAGLKNIAIPFKFVDQNGTAFIPKRSMIMIGSTKH